jgi:hypothetical protein
MYPKSQCNNDPRQCIPSHNVNMTQDNESKVHTNRGNETATFIEHRPSDYKIVFQKSINTCNYFYITQQYCNTLLNLLIFKIKTHVQISNFVIISICNLSFTHIICCVCAMYTKWLQWRSRCNGENRKL